MDSFKEHIIASWNQPQLFSLVITTLIICIVSVIIFVKARKIKPSQSPTGIVLIAEAYVGMVENNFLSSTDGKLSKAKYYIFTLASFLLVGNLVSILGLEPISTSYSIPLVLALSSWIGIYVVGLTYRKLRFLKKYINVLEVIGQFAPLISLGFRVYGNIIGGGSIVLLIYLVCGIIWTKLPGMAEHEWYFFAPIITPFLHMYFDLLGAVIQAYVFTLLTTIYWVNEMPTSEEEAKMNEKKNIKTYKVKQEIY
ncbi:F0F1 ATP synthase subunit A [Mycoplasmopsis alligatoris]|uniref:ATP synthase, A subunit n=1 Tax=Mycoplasmopsis alligatoris A21JP2 TaxID=747682 RepID=D4XX20_9BACT|nr:F0F1 ATP synthase subunit A [Mycoplasmopsis alligatoris]EFF41107.1 ATP synthase, A subunit [Mycoplasmopsis alligatoris A21JP2]